MAGSRRNERRSPPAICPVCGEDVPPTALACPECGADHESGWRTGLSYLDESQHSEGFDYDRFIEVEFGTGAKSPKPHGISWLWWFTAIIVLLSLLVVYHGKL